MRLRRRTSDAAVGNPELAAGRASPPHRPAEAEYSPSRPPSGLEPRLERRWEKGSGPFCRDGPAGAAHKWGLTPFRTASES